MSQLAFRNQPHYCRECGKHFSLESDEGLRPLAPHSAVWMHQLYGHPDESVIFEKCSRYCTQREQPEEQSSGRRLYGKNVPPVPQAAWAASKAKLDSMFPED